MIEPNASEPHPNTHHLFSLPSDLIAVTTDDCYTPRWVFDAMGLRFDLDVAAPPGGPWHVPCERFYTAEDDGLTSPWDGLVWCNPPYSDYTAWAARFASHLGGGARSWASSCLRSAGCRSCSTQPMLSRSSLATLLAPTGQRFAYANRCSSRFVASAPSPPSDSHTPINTARFSTEGGSPDGPSLGPFGLKYRLT